MIILGLNAFHGDSAAALVRNGQLVAAAEEERFRRVKHWAGFPSQAIAYCLREADLALRDIQHVAVNQDSRANLHRKLAYLVTHRPDVRLILNRLRNRRARQSIPDLFGASFPGERFVAEVHRIEHHLAHLSSAFHVSPFDEAVVVSIDGFGDFSSAAWGIGNGTKISIDGRVYFPHSLGVFYQALTQYLGFPHYGDEYKVMGLAPYGRPVSWMRCVRSFGLNLTEVTSLILLIFDITVSGLRTNGLTARPNSTIVLTSARAIAWAAPRARRTARRSSSRYRTLGAVDVRGSVLSSDQ